MIFVEFVYVKFLRYAMLRKEIWYNSSVEVFHVAVRGTMELFLSQFSKVESPL